MKNEQLRAFTRKKYERIKLGAKRNGLTVITRYRKGLKKIRMGDINLSENTINNLMNVKEVK